MLQRHSVGIANHRNHSKAHLPSTIVPDRSSSHFRLRWRALSMRIIRRVRRGWRWRGGVWVRRRVTRNGWRGTVRRIVWWKTRCAPPPKSEVPYLSGGSCGGPRILSTQHHKVSVVGKVRSLVGASHRTRNASKSRGGKNDVCASYRWQSAPEFPFCNKNRTSLHATSCVCHSSRHTLLSSVFSFCPRFCTNQRNGPSL